MPATKPAASPTTDSIPPFEHSYAALPEHFYAPIDPAPVRKPLLLRLNQALVEELGLDADWLAGPDGVAMLAGNRLPATARPIAMAYAGHQFGQFVPSLGDGRAILLGEVIDRAGRRRDVQLKGAGRTPFSRSGDGRAVLGPVLREYILGEAMQGLGIPTTRALAIVATGEPVFRERPEPGAILTRVAASHIRVGTFEYFARRGDIEAVRTLADHLIRRHYQTLREPDLAGGEPYAHLLAAIATRQGELIARWLLVGFIHGVMNTDNMALSGETIDYGPCAFMDEYDPNQVYSSIDHFGRYAYGQQPSIGLWNLTQLANCLLPLLDDDIEEAKTKAHSALDAYGKAFAPAYYGGLRAKIGLIDQPGSDQSADDDLVQDLLGRMAAHRADFTNTFRLLSDVTLEDPTDLEPVRHGFTDPTAFDAWAKQWRNRLAQQHETDTERQTRMRALNPAFIPRNHRVQEVIDAATERGDLEPLEQLLAVVSRPYDEHPSLAAYRNPPEPHEVVQQTFCGT
ncbi:MAG: YdiU family protein [Thiohalocapsa sp.]|uniref:protein adenylyltransferase SelO n=1 Tax=Thiohalocapsa sp. TaxID=2497641 RepID=UPI0025F78CFE|nr:YdiU family protein [Thiohalocapsa sp.]MCG6940030.1 YdiU family protein [Thiohalocapsa sp.]